MNVKAIAAGAALLLVGIGIGGSMNSDEDKQPETRYVTADGTKQRLVPAPSETAVTTAAPTTTTTGAPSTTTTEAPTTTTTTATPKWVTVSKLTGRGSKNGPQFQLQGGEQRVKYSCSMPADSYVGSTSFWIDLDRFSCETEEGKPSMSGDSQLYLDSGSHHFEINATPNNSWSITIEELR